MLRGFRRNQGLLLAGAVAYYALLSALPLLILTVIGLSHFVEQDILLQTLGRYLEWLVPSQSQALLADLSHFLDDRGSIGALLFVTLLFFSSLAFSVLEKALAVIFAHRERTWRRHALISAVLPYGFVLLLGCVLLVLTLSSASLQAMAGESVHLLGFDWPLAGVSGFLLRGLGVLVATFVFAAIYLIVPVGRMPVRHALLGGFAAALLWEILRHLLVWYFTHLSKVSIVYGSLTTAVVALFGMELAATLLLLGAQVIAEYERLEEVSG